MKALARNCASILALGTAALGQLPGAGSLPPSAFAEARGRPPTCGEAAATSGKVSGEATGGLTAELAGEAFFALVDQPGGAKALRLTLTEPQLGRWEMRFSVDGLSALPAAGDFTVSPGGPGSGTGAGAGKSSTVTGELYMFDADALHGRDFVPRQGTLSLDEVDQGAICGRFDVTWRVPGAAGNREVRTRGSFEAADSGLGGLGGPG